MGLIRGRGESVIHRPGRDTILHGMGLALDSKHNGDQQLLSLADCKQTRHVLDYSLFTGAQESSHGGPFLASHPLRSRT